MKKLGLVLFALVVMASMCSAQTRTKPLDSRIDSLFPNRPTNYLTDLAGIVKNPDAVNAQLKAIREQDKLSLVVVTLPTIGSRSVEDVAREIGRKWLVATANDSVGSLVRNTGGVILLVPSIRKCRVEVATGSEGYMTDGRSAQACRAAADYFRAGNFGDGFISIANTFAQYHRAELASRNKTPPPPAGPFPWAIVLSVIGFIAVAIFIFAHRAHNQALLEQVEQEKRRVEQRRKDLEIERIRAETQRLAEEQERARRAALTPKQRQAEDDELERQCQERVRLAAIAEAEAEERRRRRRQEEQDEEARRPTYQAPSYDSGSSYSSGGSDSYSSGGSDSFSGGGGGSDY